MSECVVRMEMPRICTKCGLCYVCKAFNDFITNKEAGCSVMKVGMEGCLILCQLPEGHGRLVDWDALEKKGIKLARKVDEYRTEIGIPSDELFIVPAEAERIET